MFNENIVEKKIEKIEPLIRDIEIKTTEYSNVFSSIHTQFLELVNKKQELKMKTDELLEKAFDFSKVSKVFEAVQKINQAAEESLLVGDETSYKTGKKLAKWGTIFGIGVAIVENVVPLATAAYTSYKS